MSLAQYDLNLLVTLDALLRERSVTRAGRRVGLSQPATSAALRRLRDMFGDELLVRVRGGHQLTPLASALREPLQEILARVERTIAHRSAFEPGVVEREFRIMASDYAVMVLAEPLSRHLAREAPRSRLHMIPMRDDTARWLKARRTDLVVHPLGTLPGFESQVLFEDRWTCVVWKGNREVGKRLDKRHFERLPHVQFAIDRIGLSLLDRHLEQLGVRRRVEVRTGSFVTCPFLVKGTNRVATLPVRLARVLAAASETKLHPLPYPTPDIVEVMSWNALDTHDPAHAWFRGAVGEVVKTLMRR